MTRNYDGITPIPYNSTMQDELEIDEFSLISNQYMKNSANEILEAELEENLDLSSYNKYENSYENFLIPEVPNKKVFKSFQEKYPMTIGIPQMNCFTSSQNSLDGNYLEYSSNTGYSIEGNRKNRSNDYKILGKHDLHKIYQELNVIHNKLVDEYEILQEREESLRQREIKLKADEERLLELAQLDTKLKLQEIKINYDKELDNLRNEFKEKFKDHKRLNEAFKSTKQSNESLKKQLKEKDEKIIKLEKQYSSLNSRLINLQKKNEVPRATSIQNEIKQNQQSENQCISKASKPTVQNLPIAQHQTLVHNANILEAFAMLLDWLGHSNLKENLKFNLPLTGNNQTIDKSCRLLPLLVELIIHLNSSTIDAFVANSFKKYHLAFLEFIYWSLLHYDLSYQSTKVNLTSTFRRIGEELYRSYNKNYQGDDMLTSDLISINSCQLHEELQDIKETEKEKNSNICLFSLFLQGNNPPVRMLSCLIILRTLTQADYINNIFEILRYDLRNDNLKKIFLNYYGSWTILKWCKLSNKSFLSCSIDTYLQLSSDWEYVDMFFESCSNETWFSHIAVIMKSINISNGPKLDVQFLEKLSVLLQKLSKIKSNKKYFEMFSLIKICNELLQRHYYESNFLIMNLKSTLINLNIQPQSSKNNQL